MVRFISISPNMEYLRALPISRIISASAPENEGYSLSGFAEIEREVDWLLSFDGEIRLLLPCVSDL
jgi:hypothetical protein